MLAYGKRKAMLCQGGTTLNINHYAFGSVQKVGGGGGFTLKLSFKGTQIRVHSWHAHLLPHFCILNGRKTNFVETKENAEKSENKKEVKKLLLYSYK